MFSVVVVTTIAALAIPAAQAEPGLRHEVTSVEAIAFFGAFPGIQYSIDVLWSAPGADVPVTLRKDCGLPRPPSCRNWTIHDTIPVSEVSMTRNGVAFAGSVPSSHAPDGSCDYWAVLEGDVSPISLATPYRAEDGTIRQPTHDRTFVLRGRGDPSCWAIEPYAGGHAVTSGWMEIRGEHVVSGTEDVPHVP